MSNAYIAASLDDERAEEIGKVIANETTRKILNFLTKKNASESDISKELNIPLNTIHYNMKQLVKTGLVESKDFYYSKKGNKVKVYRLTRKLILISPKGIDLKKSKIKSILPVVITAFLAGVAASIIRFYRVNIAEKIAGGKFMTQDQIVDITRETAIKSVQETSAIASTASDAVNATVGEAGQTVFNIINYVPDYALWFLAGVSFTLILYILISWMFKR